MILLRSPESGRTTAGFAHDPRRDQLGLKQAAFELLEEAMMAQHRRRIERQLAGGENLERALAGLRMERTLADGYYAWAAHLFMLDSVRELGAMRPGFLDAAEIDGLAALRSARHQFAREHPPCPHCGAALYDSFAMSCETCQGQIERKRAG